MHFAFTAIRNTAYSNLLKLLNKLVMGLKYLIAYLTTNGIDFAGNSGMDTFLYYFDGNIFNH